MGGFGSGYKWAPRTTVESCLTLSASRLQNLGVLRQNFDGTRRVVWVNQDGYDIAGGAWELDIRTSLFEGQIWIVPAGEKFPLHGAFACTTPLPWGGLKWWFECPLRCRRKNWADCCRRVGKLYLPPNKHDFGCRVCHDLTYQSCQLSHCGYAPDDYRTQHLFLAPKDIAFASN